MEKKYTSFHQTYKLSAFIMCIGILYPNPKTRVRRMKAIFIYFLTSMPFIFMVLMDAFDKLMNKDLLSVFRHSSILGPLLGGFMKMIVMVIRSVDQASTNLIMEMDRDFAMYNKLPGTYHAVVDGYIKNNLIYTVTSWIVMITACISAFVIISTALNVYNILFKAEPLRYMIHDVVIPFLAPERRFDTPIFEIMFIYNIYIAVFFCISFIGYDGFFGLVMKHGCMKLEVLCLMLKDALKAENEVIINRRVVGVIKEQNRFFEFADNIKTTYNIYFGLLLIAAIAQIGSVMYIFGESRTVDPRYIFCMMMTMTIFFVICQYASNFKNMAEDTAMEFYCAGWENVKYTSTRHTIMFMMARAQRPMDITAFNLITYDMELFVRVVKTAYSIYTVLQS